MTSREFKAAPAVRKAQNLFIGLVGPSSSGKTYSALELAGGIQSVCGGDVAVIDTENDRALSYAEHFKFLHIPFEPPWGSLDYVAALEYAATRAKTIVIDSASHEHEGVGGMLDMQEQELERLSKGEEGKKQSMNMLAWQKPKAHRRKLLQAITRVDVNVIMCFRAKNSSKPGKDEKGKNVVNPMGFVPIAGEEFVYEMSLSALFHPGSKGVPTWNPDLPGECIAVKIPRQFEWLREREGPLNRDVGRMLAEWARGPVVSGFDKAPGTTKAQEFRPSRPFNIINQAGQAKDMKTPDAWKAKIIEIIAGHTTATEVNVFIARNNGAIADVAETHPDIADEVRVLLMDRSHELDKA